MIDMKKLFDSLKGSKTYIVAGATVTYAFLGGMLGLLSWQHAIELILGSLGMSALRHGMK